jgi:type IV pilus assembly protein PilY1
VNDTRGIDVKEKAMKSQTKNTALRRSRIAAAIALAFCSAAGTAGAALTDVAQVPLTSTSTTIIKPNIMFVLDDSGSMAYSHAPDDALNFKDNYGYTSSQCNSIYYNPNIVYKVPKKADGTDFANSSFNGAWVNGYNTGQGTADLRSAFYSYDNTSSAGNGQESDRAAYYYVYSGAEVSDFSSSSNTFYKECNSTIGTTPGKNVFTKKTVSSTSGPGSADERQNFANWFSYYRTRMLMMKSGAGRAFNAITDKYRVGFSTINYTGTTNTNSEFLNITDFDATQKSSWYSKVYAIAPGSSTPLRNALAKVGRIYAGKLGTDPVQYACQQNFTILTTDGYWNDTSNPNREDGTTDIGDTDASEVAPMKDTSGAKNTLADVAEYYYKTDLRPGVVGSAACTTGFAGADVCDNIVPVSGLDSAPWQHMTTFTLGLGVNGTLRFPSDFTLIQQGKAWPVPVADKSTTIDDLWHAAVNGRGQYFSAKDPDLLVSGLTTALAGVTARESAGAAAATSNLEPIAGDNFAFVANYRTVNWDGDVEARTIDITTGIISNTAIWSAQTQLDASVTGTSDSRRIFTIAATGIGMRDFLPGSFSAAEKLAWFTPSAAPALSQSTGWTVTESAAGTADSVINYLRGQWGNENQAGNTNKIYRDRAHVLGDIIDGKPVYAKVPPFNFTENNYQTFKANQATRQGVVYVASNDGMLHAFNADTGAEVWAYIPSFVLPKMKALADAAYSTQHQFLVDGSPTVSDFWTGSAWKTILVAGLNGGGKGYYALDVTDPASPAILWEFTDANMGLTFGNPVVGKLTSGTWIVAFTSGYNNADGIGRLFVLNASTGAQMGFSPISTGVGTAASPSGLGKISAWVDDGLNDNTIQRIYGGDMFGNLWRFDVNDILPPAGRDAFKLATLQVGAYLQPITTKPELGVVGTKIMVYVGTGRYLGASDLTDTGQQTLYGIKDDLTATSAGTPHSNACFVQQTLGVVDANTREIASPLPVDLSTKCGWFIDFNPSSSSPGERINVDMKLQLGVLGVITNIPENSACKVGGSSFIYFFDYADGSNVANFVEVTDVNGVPSTVKTTKVGERIGNSTAVGMNMYKLGDKVVTTVTTSDDKHPVYGNPVGSSGTGIVRRVLWRELLN